LHVCIHCAGEPLRGVRYNGFPFRGFRENGLPGERYLPGLRRRMFRLDDLTFFLKPVPPFRLDLSVWVLRRRPDNAGDRCEEFRGVEPSPKREVPWLPEGCNLTSKMTLPSPVCPRGLCGTFAGHLFYHSMHPHVRRQAYPLRFEPIEFASQDGLILRPWGPSPRKSLEMDSIIPV